MFHNYHRVLSVLLFMLACSTAQGQLTINERYQEIPLKEVLNDLEPKTGLLFSYSDELIKGLKVTLILKNPEIEGLLQQLALATGLHFEKIGVNQVIISTLNVKQTVCGYLFDGSTKSPLPFATLVITGSSVGYTTDENGYFLIEDVTLDQGLSLQYIGYADRQLRATDFDANNCKNFFLYPEVESLQEVVVKSYLIKGIDKNNDGSISLRSDELGILPGLVERDIFQSAQWAPGITSINETVSDVQIRGGSADQNLILYDGIKMYNTGHFFGMLSIFNPDITTKATIIKGGAGAQYGDRISGIIDIAGETQIPDQTEIAIGINGTQADIATKIKLGERTALVLSGRRSYTDLIGEGTPTFDAISEKVFQNTIVDTELLEDEEDEETRLLEGEDTFFFYDANVKFLWKPTKRDSIQVTGLLTRNDLLFRLLEENETSQDALVAENEGLSFNWSGKKGLKWGHSLEGYYSNYSSDYTNRFLDGTTIEEENIRRNSVKDIGLNATIAITLNPKHSLGFGYHFSTNEVFYRLFRDEGGDDPIDEAPDELDAEDERDFDETLNRSNTTNAFFGTYTIRPKKQSLVSLGIRASRFSIINGLYLEPRVNVEYPLKNDIRIKLTGERRYQTVSQLIEFDDTRLRLQSGTWTLTEDDFIPLLESNQYSAGLLWNPNGWTIDVDTYVKRIKGLTSFTNGFTNASEEYSQGTSAIFGLDILCRKKIGNYRIWLGYTYNSVDYRFDELSETTFSGNNDITHNLTLSNTYETGNWNFSLGWNFRSGAPFTAVDSFDGTTDDLVFQDINSSRLPDYHRLDASVSYQFKLTATATKKCIAGLSFQNIYARQVPLSIFYRVDEDDVTGTPEIEQLEQLSLGFTPNFLVRLYF